MTELLGKLIAALVDSPELVRVTSSTLRDGYLLRVQTAPDDTGKVIGKAGRTARSLRAILSALACKHGTRYELDIYDHEDGGAK